MAAAIIGVAELLATQLDWHSFEATNTLWCPVILSEFDSEETVASGPRLPRSWTTSTVLAGLASLAIRNSFRAHFFWHGRACVYLSASPTFVAPPVWNAAFVANPDAQTGEQPPMPTGVQKSPQLTAPRRSRKGLGVIVNLIFSGPRWRRSLSSGLEGRGLA